MRLTIETTPSKKSVLGIVLKDAGITLTDWFDAKLEEAVNTYGIHKAASNDRLRNLEDLADVQTVIQTLQSVDWSFTRDQTGYLSHDIHPYPAKFIPQIPRNIITRLSLRGEIVWDPFGGSGTTALEGTLLGRRVVSTDINPLGEVIGNAKTLTLTKEDEDFLNHFADQLSVLASDAANVRDALERNRQVFSKFVPPIPNINEWFHLNAIDELAYLRWRIDSLTSIKAKVLSRASFSKIILRASYQDGETRYVRKVRSMAPGSVIKFFSTDLMSATAKVRKLGPLLQFREPTFRTLDLRQPFRQRTANTPDTPLTENSVDLIVCSPPYPNANDYHLYHRFRLFWLGYDPRPLGKSEIGSHLRHQKETSGFNSYIDEMRLCLDNMWYCLRPGRFAVLVLGDAIFDKKNYLTAEEVAKTATGVGFECAGIIMRSLHTTRRSFISPARRARTEKIVILRKPNRVLQVTFNTPPYGLWKYEEVLRAKEIDAILGKKASRLAPDSSTASLNSKYVDQIRRLTFTHRVTSPQMSDEATWQSVLENGDALKVLSRRKDPKYATHGLHEYKGKFYPQLVKSFLNLAALQPGQHLLDPFCGSGTSLLEGYLNGYSAVGLDLNPLAVKIARIKTEILEVDPYLRDRLLTSFLDRIDSMRADFTQIDLFPSTIRVELEAWFPKPVLAKLSWLLKEIALVPHAKVREFLEVLVSSIVRQISHQDPRDLRIRRRDQPLADAPVKELFQKRLHEQRARLRHFAERSSRAPYPFLGANAYKGDCRDMGTFEQHGIHKDGIDLIVTSPPYATALPYIDTDRLSILLLFGAKSSERSQIEESLIGSREINKRQRTEIEQRISNGDFSHNKSATAQRIIRRIHALNKSSIVGFRRQNMASLLYRYFNDMAMVFRNLDQLLRVGGSAFFVIGDTTTVAGDEPIAIKSGKVLQEFALSVGWEVKDVIPITVTTENRLHIKNSVTENDILWFVKKR